MPIIQDGDKELVLGKMENAGYRRCFLKEEFDIRKMSNGLYVLIITNFSKESFSIASDMYALYKIN